MRHRTKLLCIIALFVFLSLRESGAVVNHCYNNVTHAWTVGCTLGANQVLISDDTTNAGFYGPLYKSIDFQMQNVEPDGVSCTNPASYTVSGGPVLQALTCADTSGVISGHVAMPGGYTGSTVYFRPYIINDNASPSGTYTAVFSCMCVGNGELATTSYGSTQNASITFSGSQYTQFDALTSLTTCGGSCAGGKQLYWKMTLSAVAQPSNSKFVSVALIYPWNPHGDH